MILKTKLSYKLYYFKSKKVVCENKDKEIIKIFSYHKNKNKNKNMKPNNQLIETNCKWTKIKIAIRLRLKLVRRSINLATKI